MPSSPTDCAQITLAVLAGGQGSRMGVSKAQLLISGEPILAVLLRRLNWPGPTLIVTAPPNPRAPGREHPPGYGGFSREVHDPVAGEGPLRGLATALAASSTELLVCIPVDMPLLGPDQIRYAASTLLAYPDALAVMWMRSTAPPDPINRVEPFPLAARRAFAPTVLRHLAATQRSLHGLAADPAVRTLVAPSEWPPEVWTNLNTPDDLRRYSELSRAQS
jgi:molybdopterin-guanine dinucleotide biosynthesis protein A